MRISDWSSDVCSSDLNILAPAAEAEHRPAHRFDRDVARQDQQIRPGKIAPVFLLDRPQQAPRLIQIGVVRPRIERREALIRSEERRVGKEWVSTCRSRWATSN